MAEEPNINSSIWDNIPTASLLTVSSKGLRSGDMLAWSTIRRAVYSTGFFYLNLLDSKRGKRLSRDLDAVRDLAHISFDMPLEQKLRYQYITSNQLLGYKPAKPATVAGGSSDSNAMEKFNIGKDDLHDLELSMFRYPNSIEARRKLLARFSADAHKFGAAVLKILGSILECDDQYIFARRHQLRRPSDDYISLTYSPPTTAGNEYQPPPAQTESASLTLLFKSLGGLQINFCSFEACTGWQYIKPLEGHAVIYFGEALSKLTGGILKSARSRVASAPGWQGILGRYDIEYLMHPNHDVLVKALQGFKEEKEPEVSDKFGDEYILNALGWQPCLEGGMQQDSRCQPAGRAQPSVEQYIKELHERELLKKQAMEQSNGDTKR